MKKISIKNMSKEEWLRLRKEGIGGSDAGAICGLNPYSSPMKIYLDKTDEAGEHLDNEAMRVGRDLEEYVAKRFMEDTGKKVRRSNYMYFSEEHPFMLADIDRMVVGENAALECKTANIYQADKWKDGSVPESYFIQCQHYMAVLGMDAIYIAVLIMGKEFLWCKLERDQSLIDDLIQIEEHFWNHYIIPRVMPEPDGSKVCDEILEKYFHTSVKDSEIALIGFDEKLGRREEVNSLIEKLETEKKQIEQEIKMYMQHNEQAASDRYRVSWKQVSFERLDSKRMKQEQPELYRQFLNISSYRRFTVKMA